MSGNSMDFHSRPTLLFVISLLMIFALFLLGGVLEVFGAGLSHREIGIHIATATLARILSAVVMGLLAAAQHIRWGTIVRHEVESRKPNTILQVAARGTWCSTNLV